MRKLLFTMIATVGLLFSSSAYAACGKTEVAEMNWTSGQVVAEILGFVLQAGYDCDATLVSTSTVPAITAMGEKGTPHINPEAWVNSIAKQVDAGLSAGKFVDAGDIFSDGGLEAFWIPAYMTETHPNINTAQDLYDNALVFKDPEDPRKGRFYTCPAGWACQIISNNIARGYKLDEKFNLFDPGSGESLKASIAKAYARKEPWVGYYWGPTAVLGKYPMKQIDLGKYDAKGHACNQTEECATPYGGPYPVSRVAKIMVADYAKANKDIAKFVQKMSIPNDVTNAVLAWKEDNGASANETAGYFMATYPKLWRKWVPKKVASKIQKAL